MTPLKHLNDLFIALFTDSAALRRFLALHAPEIRHEIPETSLADAAFAAADLLVRRKAVTPDLLERLVELAPPPRREWIEAVARTLGNVSGEPVKPDDGSRDVPRVTATDVEARTAPDGTPPTPRRRVLAALGGMAALAGAAVWLAPSTDAPPPDLAQKPARRTDAPPPGPAQQPAHSADAPAPQTPPPATPPPDPTPRKSAGGKPSPPRPAVTAELVTPPEKPADVPPPRAAGDATCTLNRCNLTATTGTFAGMTHVCLTIPDRDAPVRCTVDGTPNLKTALCNFSSATQQYDGTANWTSC